MSVIEWSASSTNPVLWVKEQQKFLQQNITVVVIQEKNKRDMEHIIGVLSKIPQLYISVWAVLWLENTAKIPKVANNMTKVKLTKVHFCETTNIFLWLWTSPLKAYGLKHGKIISPGCRPMNLIVVPIPKW